MRLWFIYFHTSCVRTAKALGRLRGCAGSPEPLLVAHVINTIISWAGFLLLLTSISVLCYLFALRLSAFGGLLPIILALGRFDTWFDVASIIVFGWLPLKEIKNCMMSSLFIFCPVFVLLKGFFIPPLTMFVCGGGGGACYSVFTSVFPSILASIHLSRQDVPVKKEK